MPPVRRRRTVAPTAVVNDSGPPIQSVKMGRSKKISMCVFGEPGIGKTVLVGTCGDLPPIPGRGRDKAKVLILRPPVDHTDSIDRDDIDEWELNDWAAADDALMYVRNDGRLKYDWVWLDSLSLWQDQGLDDIWEQIIAEKPHRARYGLDKGDIYINMSRIGRWVRHMVGCPDWHFGITCHPRQAASKEDQEEPDEKLMPWVQGKNMPQKICGYMNIVGYYAIDNLGKGEGRPTRVMYLNQTTKYYAKDQFNSTESGRVINPTMPKLFEGIAKTTEFNSVASTGGTGKRTTKRRRAVAGRK